jgi:hypothetical protein
MKHDPALIEAVAKALHDATGMRSVRWADIGKTEQAFRLSQAITALDAMKKMGNGEEQWLTQQN